MSEPSGIEEKVFASQVEGLYDNLPSALMATVMNALVIWMVLYDHVSETNLEIWFVCNVVLSIARFAAFKYYIAHVSLHSTRVYYRVFFAGMLLSALIWGSAVLIIYPEESLAHATLLLFIVGGMAAGAMASSAYRYEVYLTYLLIVLTPFAINFYLKSSQIELFMGVTLTLFMMMMVVSSRRYYTNLDHVFRLRFENESLINHLRDEKTRYKMLNQRLTQEVEERVKAQKHLSHALEDAKQAVKAKDAFLASMSHELRTPLNAIIGFSQILQARRASYEDALMGYIDKIHIAGKNLLTLVNTILDFSKIKAGKMEYHPGLIGISGLLDEVRILVEPMAEAKSVVLKLPEAGHLDVFADHQLMKQVFVNLLSNALKFSPEKGTVTVSYHCHVRNNGMVEFAVCDEGPGISEENIRTLFDEFTQVEDSHNSGTGLGLAIVKLIVEMHGGTVFVESAIGEGSCFRFSIPKRDNAECPSS